MHTMRKLLVLDLEFTTSYMHNRTYIDLHTCDQVNSIKHMHKSDTIEYMCCTMHNADFAGKTISIRVYHNKQKCMHPILIRM